jgi:hypothetical protein
MATTRIEWFWFHAANWGFQTIDINLPPAWIGAQVSLYGVSGGSHAFAGIRNYRRRLSTGADEVHDFGSTSVLSWPPVIFDFVSSISFAAFTGTNQYASVSVRMDFWN